MPGCRMFWLVACLVVCQQMAVIAVVNEDDEMTAEDMKYKQAMEYLKRCDYLPAAEKMGDPVYEFLKALKNFQRVANIQVTGELDGNTLKMMEKLQCSGPETNVPMKRKRRAVVDFCANPRFDAVVNILGIVYGFFGEHYVTLMGSKRGQVRAIRNRWPEVPTPIDAALHRREYGYKYLDENSLGYSVERITESAHTLFFKGNKVWRYEGNSLVCDYPKNISSVYGDSFRDKIDSAFTWPASSSGSRSLDYTYFTSGETYYRYTHGTYGGRLDVFKSLDSFGCDMPSTVDAGFSYFGFKSRSAFFFKDSKFHYCLTKNNSTLGPYPIVPFWLPC